jgi:hypothetical protein
LVKEKKRSHLMTPLASVAKLYSEFLETDKKFKAARTIEEQRALLDKMAQTLREMEALVEGAESV